MNKKINFFTPSNLALLLGGIFSGFINGLLGAGGGIIIVFVLSKLMRGRCDGRDIFANALCIMLPISIVSFVIYATTGELSFDGFLPFTVPAVAGGLIGGFLLCKIKTRALKILFSILVVISGILLMLK